MTPEKIGSAIGTAIVVCISALIIAGLVRLLLWVCGVA